MITGAKTGRNVDLFCGNLTPCRPVCSTRWPRLQNLFRAIRVGAGMLLLLLFSAGVPAAWADLGSHGDSPDSVSLERMGAPLSTKPVVLDGVALFKVRGVSSYPADERAAEITRRIEEIARNAAVPVAEIRVVEQPLGSEIMAGDATIMTVVDADARVEGLERRILANVYMANIVRAIISYRSDREPRALARNAAFSLAAIGAMLVLLYGLLRLYRLLDVKLTRYYRTRLDDLEVEGFKVLQAEQMWAALRGMLGGVHALLGLTCGFLVLQFSLAQFPPTRGAATGLLDVVVSPLVIIGSGLLATIPDLVFLAILVVITRFVLRTVKLFFSAVQQGTVKLSGFDADWGLPTYRIVRILVIAFALVVAFPYIPGSHSDAFKGISLFIGVIFSLGSSSFISNIIAGYAMTYRRAFSLGDWIKVGQDLGEVTSIRMQVTHMRSTKNEEIIVPNSTILSMNVLNYSRLAKTSGLILHTTVGIGYETPWRQVEAMLLMAAKRTPRVKQNPAPFVLQTLLGDFAVTYELNVYCDDPSAMKRIYTDLHRHILDVFNEYGVAIMTPAYESDSQQPKLVPPEHWYAAPAQPPDAKPGELAGAKPEQ